MTIEIIFFMCFLLGFLLGLFPYLYLGKWRKVAKFLKIIEKRRNLIIFCMKQDRTITMVEGKYFGAEWVKAKMSGKDFFFRISEVFHIKGLPAIVTTDGLIPSLTYEELLTTQLLQHRAIFDSVAEAVAKEIYNLTNGKLIEIPRNTEDLRELMERYPQLKILKFNFNNKPISLKNIPGRKPTPDVLATIPISTFNSLQMVMRALMEQGLFGAITKGRFNIWKLIIYSFALVIILYIAFQLFKGGIPLPIGQGFR